MKIVFRSFYFIFSVFLGSQVNAQDMSGWSDDRVCQHQGGFNDEVYARGLNCKALTASNSGNALSETDSYKHLDLISKPRKVLSNNDTKSLWNAYKKAPVCFEHPTYGYGVGYKLKKIQKKELHSNSWTSPFYKYEKENRHKIKLRNNLPKPIITINLNEDYGEQNAQVNSAITFFQNAAYVARVGKSIEEIEKVKTVLLDWANNNALKKGINVSWGDKPVDWHIMVLINSILTTTAVISESFNSNERQILGSWLNNLIKKVAKSKWKDRQDNKAYQTSYMTLIWGLMVNDLNAVQNSIDVVKLAVHDMRPDGSFPIDTQRGGMGIDYNSKSYGYLLMMASILKGKTGEDLFSYHIDGRSLHNGADFVIKSIKEPSKMNSIYAISCPDGGDRWGTIEKPSTYFIENATNMMVYAKQFPLNENSDFIMRKYEDTFDNEYMMSPIKSKPSELFTLHPMLIAK